MFALFSSHFNYKKQVCHSVCGINPSDSRPLANVFETSNNRFFKLINQAEIMDQAVENVHVLEQKRVLCVN